MQTEYELLLASTSVEDLAIQRQIDANPLTGAAVIRVPLSLPDERSAFRPSLELEYNSSAGNSAFGVGWSLARLPTISIDTRKALPKYEGRDSYLANGGDELVPVLQQQDGRWQPRTTGRGGFWVQYLRSKGERSYMRFERRVPKGTGRIYRRYRDGNNVIKVNGLDLSGESRVLDPGYDLEHEGCIFLWTKVVTSTCRIVTEGTLKRGELASTDGSEGRLGHSQLSREMTF